MARLFGTDGVRGIANRDLTAELALSLAQAAALVLGEESRSIGARPKAVIARDPRISGEFQLFKTNNDRLWLSSGNFI